MLRNMNLPHSHRAALLVAIFLTLLYSEAAFPQSLENRLDSLLEGTFTDEGPGAVFLVAKAGEPVYRKAFGMANLELQVPMDTEMVFEIGSMTKQFTAVAVLLLEEQGKLSLDESITKYIPDYPVQGKTITVHHLLTHTSGIKSFTSMKPLRTIERQDLSSSELLDFFKDEPMDFEPGAQFKYNNSGYMILGYLIEQVSGQSYADFVQTHIFQKLGMHASRYASHSELIPHRAYGYHQKEEYVNKTFVSTSLPYASGSLMSTVDDMQRWNEALHSDQLISAEGRAKLFQNYTLDTGENIDYGYGWHISKVGKQLSYEHGGSIFGFKSMGVYLPEADIYVVGLSNCDCNSPTALVRLMAEFALEY